MFPKRIRFILKFFDVLGFYTESSPKSCKAFYYAFHIISVSYLAVQLFTYFSILYEWSYKAIEELSIITQYSSSLMTYCVIIVDSISNQRAQRHFWRICKNLNELHSDQKYSWWRFLFKFTEFYLMAIVSIVAASTNQRLRTIILVIAITFVVKICHTRIFHYLLYLEIIRREFRNCSNRGK